MGVLIIYAISNPMMVDVIIIDEVKTEARYGKSTNAKVKTIRTSPICTEQNFKF